MKIPVFFLLSFVQRSKFAMILQPGPKNWTEKLLKMFPFDVTFFPFDVTFFPFDVTFFPFDVTFFPFLCHFFPFFGWFFSNLRTFLGAVIPDTIIFITLYKGDPIVSPPSGGVFHIKIYEAGFF